MFEHSKSLISLLTILLLLGGLIFVVCQQQYFRTQHSADLSAPDQYNITLKSEIIIWNIVSCRVWLVTENIFFDK